MLTICAYWGTIKGAEPDLNPICKNKKKARTRPEWTQRVGPRRACRALVLIISSENYEKGCET